jgi:hypothetical protein
MTNLLAEIGRPVDAPHKLLLGTKRGLPRFWCREIQGRGTQAHRGRIAMFKIVGTLPVKTRLPLMAWVLAGLVTLFSLVTSLTQVSGPMVQAAKPETAHYASMTDLLDLFGTL